MKSKVVLLTSANYFTIAKFRYSFISKLIADGHKIVLYSSYDEMSHESFKKLKNLGVKCIKTGLGRGSYSPFEAIRYILGYRKILKEYSIDTAINFTLMPMIFGGLVCRIKSLKYISVVTGLGSQYHGKFIARWIFKFAYRISVSHSKQIWFVSNSDAKIGIDKLRLNPNKIKVVFGAGIKINPMSYSIKGKNVKKDNLKIIYMGRIRRDKGIEDYISLANKLSLDDAFSFELMGSIDSSDNYINKIVSKATLDGSIKMINFKYDNLNYLASADLLLLCSKHEGMPTVILESMGSLVIPLAADIPVIDELNKMGARIFSYTSGDINSLFEKLQLIKNLNLSEKEIILKNNYNFVSKNFDEKSIAKLQSNFFSELEELKR